MNRNYKDLSSGALSERSLDERFREASNDARNLEREPVRRAILETTINTASPARQAARIRMALKIGIWTMSALLLATLGFLAFGVFQPSSITQAHHMQATAQKQIHSQFQSTFASAPVGTILQTQSRKQNDTGFLSPVRMAGIQPTAITESQAALLGIVYYANGNIGCTLPQGQTRGLVTCTPDGHLIFGSDSTVASQRVSPNLRMITTTTGEKRFFRLLSNGMTNMFRGMGIGDSDFKGPMQANVSISPGNDAANVTDSNLPLFGSDSAAIRQMLASQGLDMKPGQHMTMTLNMNGSLDDSTAANEMLASLGISKDQVAAIMKKEMDSAAICKLISEQISKKIMANMLSNKGALKHMFMNAMTDVAAHAPDVNKLVPVLVENNNGGASNSLIFWFDPAPELETILGTGNGNILPAHVSTSGALTSLMISPNPATTSATLRYSLASERSLAVSLYDITGNKVLDIARRTGEEAGAGELPVDLSSVAPGIYILSVVTDRGEQLTQRIVVEH